MRGMQLLLTPRDLIRPPKATLAPIADPIGASGSLKRKTS